MNELHRIVAPLLAPVPLLRTAHSPDCASARLRPPRLRGETRRRGL